VVHPFLTNHPFPVLSAEERASLFPPCLQSLVRISRAFPPLAEDAATLLIQYGKVLTSESSIAAGYYTPRDFDTISGAIDLWGKLFLSFSYWFGIAVSEKLLVIASVVHLAGPWTKQSFPL